MHPVSEEDVVVMETQHLKLEIGVTSAAIRRATLKEYSAGSDPSVSLQFSGTYPLISVQIGSAESNWKTVSTSASTAEFSLFDAKEGRYRLVYSVSEHSPVIDMSVSHESGAANTGTLALTTTWVKGDNLSNRNNPLEAVFVGGELGNTYRKMMAPVKAEKDVPRGTSMVSLAERYFCQSVKLPKGTSVKILPTSEGTVAAETIASVGGAAPNTEFRASIYLGPRDFFQLKKAGFEKAFKIGVLGQIGLVLVKILDWTAGITKNYGVALILLSALVTSLMAPFTLLSFRSMKKMQELKPELDRIMARHKDDPKKANVEVFALYKQHRVSPLSGCLPMLLQMPVFIALFQAISHFIGLRGAGFLWIKDLSLPDRIAHLPVTLPFLGNEVNLLPIVMAGAMYFQTKMSQKSMGSSSGNPTAQMMSGPIMPVLFGVMFYQFPSGLVLYWLTNSIMSLVWYRLAS